MPITPIFRPTRRRTLVAGGVAALLLTALAADRVAAHQAEHRTARAFRSATGTAELPDVDVRGFPVLPQLARGTIDIIPRPAP
ncbi:LmeA family phospholipid-binding protein [Streptomyces microflavus]